MHDPEDDREPKPAPLTDISDAPMIGRAEIIAMLRRFKVNAPEQARQELGANLSMLALREGLPGGVR